MKKLLIIGLVLIGILAFFFWRQSFYLSWHLRPLGISMEGSGYKVADYNEFIFQGRKNVEILAEKNNDIIRFKIIENIEKEPAQKRIEEIFYRLEAHFEPKEILGIYADLIDAVAGVPEELKPQRETVILGDKETPCFVAFADKYFSYYVATKEQAVYRGILAMTYCPKEKNLVNIEILAPKEKFNFEKVVETLKTFQCR